LAGALLFDGNPPKCCFIMVCIAGCWNSLLTSRNPKTIDVSLAYLEHGSAKRSPFEHMQTVIQTSISLDLFLHEAAKNFELLSNIKDQK
jgi:hypothetical protein